MRTFLVRRYAHHRGFAVGLAIALLAFVFLCPAMLPAACAGHHQTCQGQTCWILGSGAVLPVLIIFAWKLLVMLFPLSREYPLLLFRPPRPRLASFL
jgi:hypothetical protein